MDADGVGPRRAGSDVVVVVRRGVVPLVAEVLDVELKLQLVADLVEQRAIQAGEAFEGDSVVGRGVDAAAIDRAQPHARSEEHTSELQSLMRNSYDVVCLKNKIHTSTHNYTTLTQP